MKFPIKRDLENGVFLTSITLDKHQPMNVLLDTNILLHLLRQDATGKRIIREYKIYDLANIFDRYAEIDAFSQSKHPTLRHAFTARNMGKNDLWIAATASVLGARLLTTDGETTCQSYF